MHKSLFVALAALFVLVATPAWALQVVLEWTHPDPSLVTGYNIYYGDASGQYLAPVDAGNTFSWTLEIAQENDDKAWFFAATAYNQYGESAYSPEASTIIEGLRLAPGGMPSLGKITQIYPDGKTVEVNFIDRTVITTLPDGTVTTVNF